jgi:Transposase DDE domain
MEKALKLIKLYTHICVLYESELQWEVQRFSPNEQINYITDQELLTISLFCTMYEQKTTQKAMYDHIIDYWASWFPTLPAYQNFNIRLNRLVDAYQLLLSLSMEAFELSDDKWPISVGDSMPIITCSHKRKPKVALNFADKGYCATKKLNYYGVKLHSLGLHRKGKVPFPTKLGITPASTHDLTALKPILELINTEATFLDKAYCDAELAKKMKENGNCLLTPVKKVKGMPLILQQFDKASNDLFSTAVSTIRQPVESFYNWIQQKTNIHIASKVRSEKGLYFHIYSKLVAAVLLLLGF